MNVPCTEVPPPPSSPGPSHLPAPAPSPRPPPWANSPLCGREVDSGSSCPCASGSCPSAQCPQAPPCAAGARISFSAAERDSLRDGRTASIHSPISGCCVVTTCAVVSDTARMGVHVCGSRVTRTDGNSVYKFFEKLPTVLRSFYQDVI